MNNSLKTIKICVDVFVFISAVGVFPLVKKPKRSGLIRLSLLRLGWVGLGWVRLSLISFRLG
jgi:hypothetical protein